MSKKKLFTGTVGRTMAETRYSYHITDTDPKNAPNIIYIVLDDMGFAHLGCYGSNISTPNIDRLAYNGLRYNNFHTTAVCSATRCSLLTGANHHTAGCASLIEMRTGAPNNIDGELRREYALLPEILKEYGYATFAVGKWHLSTSQDPTGNPDNWPVQRGFDRYYGFLNGENDQYNPHLIRDNTAAPQPKTAKEGYHFSEDAVDNALDYLFEHNMNYPDKPFFLYLAFGAMHTPHHAPKKYIDAYKGKFDDGWDIIRQQWFENQKKLGVIPQEAELTDKNEYIDDWADLSDKQKAVYAREMEAYAGMLTHTDDQIGKLIDYLELSGKLDNTVIVFLSDNGASAEGGVYGRFNSMSGMDITSRPEEEIEFAYEHLDEIGSEYAFNHYPTGWANAGNTPFQWYKIWAHEGGIKDPLIIHYPAGIKNPGAVRGQYHHVSDITPTMLDIIGVDKPEFIKGYHQQPFTGTSMKYTLDDPDEPSRKHIQYYEVHGNRGIYKDGWKAVVNHCFTENYADDEWELYHVDEDYSEKHNVADKYPDKLLELREDFMHEAGKYNVFPMLRFSMHADPEKLSRQYADMIPTAPVKYVFEHVIKPVRVVSERSVGMHMITGDYDYTVTAFLYRDNTERDGVIYANGHRFGGSSFYIKDNRLKFVYNANSLEYFEAVSDNELPAGEIKVAYHYHYDTKSKTSLVTLYVNDEKAGETTVTRLIYIQGYASVSLLANFYSPVTEDYEIPFAFKGRADKIVLEQHASVVDPQEELAKLSAVE